MSSSGLRTLRVLDEVAHSGRPIGVSELARKLSLPAASVFRSLDALIHAGLVTRYRESARCVTGPAAQRLHRSIIARFPMREICLPYLRQLASMSGETTALHVRLGWYSARIGSVPGTGEVIAEASAGEMLTLNRSAAGEVILAFLSRSERIAFQKWYSAAKSEPAQSRNPRVRAARHSDFDNIAAQGFAFRADANGSTIAFPIRAQGRAFAAVSIESPFTAPAMSDHIPAWQEVVARIEALAAAQPAFFANPYGHLDPDTISLCGLPTGLSRPE